jgi:hypothetical protein
MTGISARQVLHARNLEVLEDILPYMRSHGPQQLKLPLGLGH